MKTVIVLASVLCLSSVAFGQTVVTDDFEDNADGRFQPDASVTYDFTQAAVLEVGIQVQNWFYIRDYPDMATPAWVPPAYDFTGATITYDEYWDIDNTGGRALTNQILFLRIYSGTWDGTSWTLTGYEDFAGATPPEAEATGLSRSFVEGTGTITNYGGGVFDPSQIYRWRWHGTDWDQVAGDEVWLRDFEVTVPEPGTLALMGVGLLSLLGLRRRK
jgi:hypothetical protein